MVAADHYALLGVSPGASEKEVKKAFRAKARQFHPDKQPPNATEAAKKKAKQTFQQIAVAYEVLSDPAKRADYNLTRRSCSGERDDDRSGGRAGSAAGTRPPGGGSAPRRPPGEDVPHWHRFRYQEDDTTWREERRARWQREEEAEKQAEFDRLAREEKRRQEDKMGLGTHWVKAPKWAPSNGWSGWSKSGAGPQDNDAASEASSVLSFEIGINLDDLNLDDLEAIDTQDAEMEVIGRGGEVWRPSGSAHEAKQAERPSAPSKADSSAAAAAGPPAQKQCCSVQ
eukprot:TRINITY_DN60239_c0_g1_i1.p1 TRINITY_DN60239_c0_g1~~TRINITY_DN60239_c0_g1_i1.p1  ORF type:complete len:284 (-),score=64.07 TRINITY_DN60239_c0_g1_i1:366-1217(-)